MRNGLRRALLCILLAAAGCASPIKTMHDSDPDADFGRYASFAWLHQDPSELRSRRADSVYVSALDDRRIRAAIDDELRAKGYRKEDDFEEADLVVAYSVGEEEKVQVRQTPGMDTVYTSPYGHGPWYGHSRVSVSTYTEGTLAIQFYERESRQGVWVGFAIKRLYRSDDSESLIKRAVAAILEPFPARQQ